MAVLIRFIRLPYAFYGTTGELYRDLSVLYDFLFLRIWPLLGPVSSFGGLSFGAIYYYLLAPFYWLFHYSPQGLVFASGFFSVGGVVLSYFLLKAWLNNKYAALLGMLLLCFSLYDIQNSYYISNPTLLPFFLLWFFYSLTLIMQNGVRFRYVAGLAISFGIATQLHSTAMVVLPVILLWLLLQKKIALNWKQYIIMVFTNVVLYFPFLFFEVTHDFENFRRLLALGGHNFSLFIKAQSAASIVLFWSRSVIFQNSFVDLSQSHPWVYYLLLPWPILFLLGVLFFLRRVKPINRLPLHLAYPGKMLLFLWISISTLMFLFFQPYIQHFYFLVLWPAPILLLVGGLWWLRQNSAKLFIIGVIVFLSLQLVQLFYFYPVITHKQFGFSNMIYLFRQIQNDAGADTFKIINKSFDVNLFVYYSKILQLPGRAQKKAQVLYLIYEPNSTESLRMYPAGYQYLQVLKIGGFSIDKYILLK